MTAFCTHRKSCDKTICGTIHSICDFCEIIFLHIISQNLIINIDNPTQNIWTIHEVNFGFCVFLKSIKIIQVVFCDVCHHSNFKNYARNFLQCNGMGRNFHNNVFNAVFQHLRKKLVQKVRVRSCHIEINVVSIPKSTACPNDCRIFACMVQNVGN